MKALLYGRTVANVGSALVLLAASALLAPVHAGSGANFVTYNHHTADRGEVEVKLLTDISEGSGNEYFAQLVELEYGISDRWTAALLFEGADSAGDDYQFGGWRFENRFRLFDYGAVPLNPVLYVEYEQLEPSHRYLHTVAGRAGEANEDTGDDEGTEHAIETRLILGEDLSDRLDVAFNWISEVNLDSGDSVAPSVSPARATTPFCAPWSDTSSTDAIGCGLPTPGSLSPVRG